MPTSSSSSNTISSSSSSTSNTISSSSTTNPVYIVSGIITPSNWNGHYEPVGTFNGEVLYRQEDGYAYLFWGNIVGPTWIISASQYILNPVFYNDSSEITDNPYDVYGVGISGSAYVSYLGSSSTSDSESSSSQQDSSHSSSSNSSSSESSKSSASSRSSLSSRSSSSSSTSSSSVDSSSSTESSPSSLSTMSESSSSLDSSSSSESSSESSVHSTNSSQSVSSSSYSSASSNSSSSLDSSSSSSDSSSSDSSSIAFSSSSSSSIASETSSSSSYLDYSDNGTLPFIFEKAVDSSFSCMAFYDQAVFVGTKSGSVLKSEDRQMWSIAYSVNDYAVTALLVQDGLLFMGTSPRGKIYIVDLTSDTIRFSQEVGGEIVSFFYIGNKVYSATSNPANIYEYNKDTKLWDKSYSPYASKVYGSVKHDGNIYLLTDSNDLVMFDGNSWTMPEIGVDNIASSRNISKEPFSHHKYKFIDRSSVNGTDNMAEEDIFGIFPQMKINGFKSGASDGGALVLGSSNYGKLFYYMQVNKEVTVVDSNGEEITSIEKSYIFDPIFQTESANTIHALLNVDFEVNLAAIDNKVYLIYGKDIAQLSTTTTTTTKAKVDSVTTTTTTIPFSVLTPENSSQVIIGSPLIITWVSSKSVNDPVTIELFKGNDLSLTINPKTNNTGSYEWFVPASVLPGVDYTIKITWITSDTSAQVSGSSGSFAMVYTSAPTTTTTTTTEGSKNMPDRSYSYPIAILSLPNGEYITSMAKDEAMGGIIFLTSNGRILTCYESLVNAYMTGDRTVYAEVKDGFGNVSDQAWTSFFYALYNKVVEVNDSKEIIEYKYAIDTVAIKENRVTGVYISPEMLINEDLGFWRQLIWQEVKPEDTEITVCLRSADTKEDLLKMPWDFCFISDDSDVNGSVVRDLLKYKLDGKYIQFKVTMSTDKKSLSPSIANIGVVYSTKYAVYFFTTKFSLDPNTDITTGLMTANVTQPPNTELRFGIANKNSSDWNDYKTVNLDRFFELSKTDKLKVGIKMISYGDNIPSVGEFAIITGGQKINLING